MLSVAGPPFPQQMRTFWDFAIHLYESHES